jgi:hypothetical protein
MRKPYFRIELLRCREGWQFCVLVLWFWAKISKNCPDMISDRTESGWGIYRRAKKPQYCSQLLVGKFRYTS